MDLLEVQEVSSEHDFAALRNTWNAVLVESSSNSIFLTWEWLHTWWEHFGHQKTLHAVLFRDAQDRLVGIAPFFKHRRHSAVGPLDVLSFLGSDIVASDYLDFIIVKGSTG